MYWLRKWLESYNNCTFSTWKDKFVFNLLFWIPNSFCTFLDYGRGGTHFLSSPDGPSLIFYHSDFWTTCLPWKTELPWKFSLHSNIFHLSGFLRNFNLPWKQSLSLNFSLHLIYFLQLGYLRNLCLPWKTKCALNSLYSIYISYHSEFWTACACPEKQNLPWNFSLYWNIFNFQDFWATWACPENRVCPEIFKPEGAAAPPPRTPLRSCMPWFFALWICLVVPNAVSSSFQN